MAHLKTAKKRIKQNEKSRLRNRAALSEVRTQLKKVLRAIKDKDVSLATTELQNAYGKLDKAAMRGYLHKNTAYRYKSRLTKRVNALKAAPAATS
jgi:small subunit ribosomal protein S20